MSTPNRSRVVAPAALGATAAAALLSLLAACAGAAPPRSVAPPAAADASLAAEMTGRYTGILVDMNAATYPRDLAQRLTVRVDRLTPSDEADRMAEILRDRGNAALEDELWRKDVGRIQVDQGLGYPIAAALAFEEQGMGRLVLVITRPISIGEIFSASRSADYPFSVVSLDVDEEGEGSGELVPAARLHFGTDGRLIVDEYGFQPMRVLNVARVSG